MEVHLWICVSLTMVLVTFCLGSPTIQRHNRAVADHKLTPTTNNDDNQEDPDFKEFWLQKNEGLCPFGQVLHRNKSVCCYVTACGPDYEIEECSKNGTEDKCSRCKPGFLQKNNISSLNMEEGKCFEEIPSHKECPLDFMKTARKILDPETFPLPCECLFEKCYVVDDVGDCSKNAACSPNSQMNRITGTCEPCPWYGYKYSAGCQPCTINVTLLRQGKPGGIYTSPKLETTTVSKEEEEEEDSVKSLTENKSLAPLNEPGKESQKLDTVYIILLAVIATALVVIMIAVTYSCYKKRNSSGSATAPPTPSADSAPLLPGQAQVMPTPTEVRNGYGNILYQNNNNTLTQNFQNGHVRNGYAGNRHFHDNLRHENHTAGSEHKDLIGEHQFSLEEETNQLQNGDVQFPRNVKDHEQNKEFGLNKSAYKQTEDQAEKMNIQQAVLIDRMQNGLEEGQDRMEEVEVETVQGAVGGTVDNICGDIDKMKDEHKVSKGEKKDRNKPKSVVSIHNNEFNNCHVYIKGTGQAKVKTGSKEKLESLGSVSGTYEMDSSCDSSGVSSAPTVWVPRRRNVNQNKGNSSNDTNEIESKDEPSYGDDLGVIKGSDKPTCRPELSNSPCSDSPGSDVQPEEELTSNDIDKDVSEKAAVRMQDVVEDENHQAPGQPETAGILKPFQLPVARGRQIARVAPIRQNSEVQHVSGYPSERLNNDESNGGEQSVSSMSYAFMHADSDLNNGFMLSHVEHEIGENENDHPESMQNSGGQSRFSVRQEGCGQTLDMQRNCNAVAPTRLDVNQTRVNHSITPMGEREGPEGNSVTYIPENDHFVSRPDMQETDRKVAADEVDPDITEEKLVGNNDTGAKIIDIDDDITEYKRKFKESQPIENETDLKKNVDSVNEESFEINMKELENQCNVEDILYEEDETVEVKNSLNEEDVSTDGEKSFEIISAENRNIDSSRNPPGDTTRQDEVNGDDLSESFEINSKDFINSEKLNEEAKIAVDKDAVEKIDTGEENRSVEQTEESFELDIKDIEQINNNGAQYCSTDSRATSFEINSSEIGMLNLRGNNDDEGGDFTDIGEVGIRTAEADESVDERNEMKVNNIL